MEISFIILVILSLASFRLTRLIVFDKITESLRSPFFVEVEENVDGVLEVYYLPKKTPVLKFFGELLSCYWCTGVWVSVVLVAGYYYFPNASAPFLLVLAVAGIASILETLVQRWMD